MLKNTAKVTDTLECAFDSGFTHYSVIDQREELKLSWLIVFGGLRSSIVVVPVFFGKHRIAIRGVRHINKC